jgi:hypothetical protein
VSPDTLPKPGQRLRHATFGDGSVVATRSASAKANVGGAGPVVTINFDRHGVKAMCWWFACSRVEEIAP